MTSNQLSPTVRAESTRDLPQGLNAALAYSARNAGVHSQRPSALPQLVRNHQLCTNWPLRHLSPFTMCMLRSCTQSGANLHYCWRQDLRPDSSIDHNSGEHIFLSPALPQPLQMGCAGIRQRSQLPLMAGLMWGSPYAKSATVIRHEASKDHGLQTFGWTRHDLRTYGEQHISDGPLSISMQWLKQPGRGYGGDWLLTLNVSRDDASATDHVVPHQPLYLYLGQTSPDDTLTGDATFQAEPGLDLGVRPPCTPRTRSAALPCCHVAWRQH